MDKLIAAIPKNAREKIRVALSEFQANGTTHQMFAARVFYDDGAGNYRPGKNGINLKVGHLPALIAALREAEADARAAGLLLDEADEARAAETTILGAG